MKSKVMLIVSICLMFISVFMTMPVDAAKRYAVLQEETNRSFVPIRYVGETFGYKVNYSKESKSVKIEQENKYLQLTEGSKNAIVNGSSVILDAAPLNIAGSLYVPLRFVAENLGTEVAMLEKGKIQLKNSELTTSIETVPLKRFQQAIFSPVSTTSKKIATSGSSINLNLVYIDLYNTNIELDVYYANNKIGSVESFKNMVVNSNAKVAVNGTFFNAYSGTNVQVPYGYIVKDGVEVHKAPGEKRAVFVYTTEYEPKVVSIDDYYKLYSENKIITAVQAGPLLIKNSAVVVDAAEEGFKDPKILTSRGARSVIGVTKDNKLVIGTTNAASIPDLAEAMLKLDVEEAMNLDGGASSALYANGKYITPAGRELSNILTIHY